MGVDFIEKTKKSVRKKWDRSRVKLATDDLLTRTPERAGCSTAFDTVDGAQLRQGEYLTVEVDGTSLVARRGLSVVARKDKPPPDVVEAIRNSCGKADGTVEHVHDIAGVVEIVSC